MNWTFPLFRLFGIRVRMHWFLVLMIAVYLLRALSEGGPRETAIMAGTMGILLFSILFHELAHCWMAIRTGAGAEEILLWPLGGLAYTGHTGSSVDEIKIAGIGPLSNFLLTGACLGSLVLLGSPWRWEYLNPFESWYLVDGTAQTYLLHAARLNLILGLFNLVVPAYPLDGGRILFAFLTLRYGRARAAETSGSVAIIVGIALTLWGFVQREIMLAFIGFMVLFEGWQLRRLAQIGELEIHPMFGAAPEYDYMPERRRKPGFFERWRRRRAERRARREAERSSALQRDVDVILEKVSREGIQSLSAAERRILDEASRRARHDR